MNSNKEKTLNKKKVILGLSGGVDSTTAALLLKEKGYEVIGLYFDIKPERADCNAEISGSSSELSGRERAETVAKQLDIDFIYRNVADEFDNIVIGNFCSEYACGRTPNPCIVCNPYVKFRTLLDAADEAGAYYIATGHYANTCYYEDSETWFIKRAANVKKDQSYMLYRLGQEAISRLLLPLNEVDDKEKVREMARKKALVNADAKDSQEICFIDADDNYKDFLKRRGIDSSKGDFVDASGNVLGKHQGILNYTIGQRKGLGIALGKPAFVTKINGRNNQVVLGDNEDLFNKEVISSGNIFFGKTFGTKSSYAKTFYDNISDNKYGNNGRANSEVKTDDRSEQVIECEGEEARSIGFIGDFEVEAKIRYAAKPAAAVLHILEDGRIKTVFKDAQRAPTPGQSIVFYQDDIVVGGGVIEISQ